METSSIFKEYHVKHGAFNFQLQFFFSSNPGNPDILGNQKWKIIIFFHIQLVAWWNWIKYQKTAPLNVEQNVF